MDIAAQMTIIRHMVEGTIKTPTSGSTQFMSFLDVGVLDEAIPLPNVESDIFMVVRMILLQSKITASNGVIHLDH